LRCLPHAIRAGFERGALRVRDASVPRPLRFFYRNRLGVAILVRESGLIKGLRRHLCPTRFRCAGRRACAASPRRRSRSRAILASLSTALRLAPDLVGDEQRLMEPRRLGGDEGRRRGRALRYDGLGEPAHVALGHALARGDFDHRSAAFPEVADAGVPLGFSQASGAPRNGPAAVPGGTAFGFGGSGQLGGSCFGGDEEHRSRLSGNRKESVSIADYEAACAGRPFRARLESDPKRKFRFSAFPPLAKQIGSSAISIFGRTAETRDAQGFCDRLAVG